MILSKRADIDRFLAAPAAEIRAVVIYGRDRAIVRERADAVARKAVKDPNDPFDVAVLTETDLDADGAKLFGELTALSPITGEATAAVRLTTESEAAAAIETAAIPQDAS